MMKDRITHCFNKGAETYDVSAAVQIQIATYLAQYLSSFKAQNILEIGCGTGLFSQQLLTLFPHSSFLLTDIAPSMLEVCRKRVGHYSNVTLGCMDGENFQADETYDLITSSMTLHWFTDIEASFKKLITHLKPKGQFVFAMLGEYSLHEWREICKQSQYSIPTPRFPVYTVLQELFPTMKLERKILEYSYDSLYHFLRSLKNIGATSAQINHIPISSGKLRQLLRQFDKKITISYEVILGHLKKQ